MRLERRSVVVDLLVAAVAGLLALAVYVRSMAPGLLWGDSAEFQLAAWLGGFAHPTGYPLYLMLGWLWSHLIPFGDPAYRINLFSVFWGGITVALVCLVVMRLLRLVEDSRRRGPVRLVALAAALVFALTPTFWSQAVIAEVYTLHAVFVAAILLALLVWAERVLDGNRSGVRRQLYVAASLFGLSLTHHRSTILLIPAIALFAFVVLRRRIDAPQLTLRQAVILGVCVLAPLLIYLAIPLRAPHVPYFRLELAPGHSVPLYDASLAGFIAHVTGSVFRDALAAPTNVAFKLAELGRNFVAEMSPNGVFLGAIGLGWLMLRGVRDRDRRALAVLALTGAFLLVQVAFNLSYAIGDIYVFYIPAYLVWALWIAAGAWALGALLGRLLAHAGATARRWAPVLSGIATLAVLLSLTYLSAVIYWPRVQRASDNLAARAWNALLAAPIPRDAVLVTNDRDEMAPFWYLKYVEGQQTGMDGLFPLLLPGEGWADVASVTERGLDSGRPVYLVKPMEGLELKFELDPPDAQPWRDRGYASPLGPPVRVLGLVTASTPDRETETVFGEKLRLVGYDLRPAQARLGGVQQIVLYWRPLRRLDRDYAVSVQLIGADDTKAGQSDEWPGGRFFPMPAWRVGEVLSDAHTLAIALDAAPGVYELRVAVYDLDTDPLVHLGEPQVVGSVEVGP